MAKQKKPAAATGKREGRAQAEGGRTHGGSQAAYDKWLPAARRIAAGEVVRLRADPQLALHNLAIGVRSVLAERARLPKLGETDARALASLEELALAVVFASTQVVRPGASRELPALTSRAAALRALLLRTAEALTLAGLLPAAEVRKIRGGRGRLDAARDLVALAALFGKHAAALKGKHAIGAAQLKEAADLGTSLLTLLKPGRARRSIAGLALGADERDRLWTLLVLGHDRLWRAGAYLFGRAAVGAKVPSLQAGAGGRPRKVG